MPQTTYEVGQPWVIYHYPYTDRQATLRGLAARIDMECLVCGGRESWKVRIVQRVKKDGRGYAIERSAFLDAHRHPDRGHPMSWKKPLGNVAAHEDGLDVDLLAMRIQADLEAQHFGDPRKGDSDGRE